MKEKIKMLDDHNLKLKTRVHIAEKEKDHLVHYFANQEYQAAREFRPGSKSITRSSAGSKSVLQNQNYAKKMIR